MKTSEKLFLTIVLAGGLLAAVFLWAYLMSGEEAGPLPGPGPDQDGRAGMEGDEAEPVRTDIDDPEADRIAREAVEPDGAAVKDEEEAAGDFAGSGVITGRIIDEFGHPVAGSEITPAKGRRQDVFFLGSYDLGGRADAKGPKAASVEDGRFALKKIAEMDNLTLHVFHPDYVPLDLDLGFFDGVKKDAGDIRLELGGSASGYVASSSGAPLEGATVQARPRADGAPRMFHFIITQGEGFREWTAVTDKDGFYRIKGLPQGKVNITGIHPKYVPASLVNVQIGKGRENPRSDLVLELGLTIAGTVEDEDGEPVEGAEVRADLNQALDLSSPDRLTAAMFRGRETETRTDKEGAFLFEGLRKGDYTVRIDAEGFLTRRVKEVKAGTRDLACVLSRGGWLAGKVLDAVTSAEIEKFEIEVTQRRGGTSKARVLKGKEALEKRPGLGEGPGAYYLEGLKDGPFFITVTAEGYGDERIKDLTAAAGKGAERVVKLWPEAAVSGKVFSAAGEPVDDATVEIRTPTKKGDALQRRQQAIEVRLAGLGYAGDDSSFGQDKWSRRVKSKEDGSFVIRGIPDGEFELSASHEDHLDAEPLSLTLNRGDEVKDLALRLRAAGSIAGTVFDLDGKPKARARLSAAAIREHGWPSGSKKKATSDEEGRYAIKGLSPGNYRVRIAESEDSRGLGLSFIIGGSHSGKPAEGLVPVEVGKVTPFDVYEVPMCGIEGVVTEAGRPVEGLSVNLFKSENRGFIPFAPLKTARTDAFGAYAFEELTPGTYKVKLEISGLPAPLGQEVELAAGERERADFTLPTGRISGKITNELTGDAAVGVRVSLEQLEKKDDGGGESSSGSVNFVVSTDGGYWGFSGGGPGPVETDENGCYMFRFVPDGEYALNATGGGYVAGSLSPVPVTGGLETAGQNLKLIKGLTVSGTIIDGSTGKALKKYLAVTCGRIVKQGEESESHTASSSGNGRFNFSNLPPGLYRVEVPGDSGYAGALEVRLEREDANEVELVVHSI